MKVLFLYQGKTSDPSFRACKLPLFKELEGIEFKIVVLEDDLDLDIKNIEILLEKKSILPKYIVDILLNSTESDFDLIHALKPGTSLPSYLMSKITDKPFVLDADDYDWTGNLIYKKVGDFLTTKGRYDSFITASKELTDWFHGEYLPFTADLKKFNRKRYSEERKKIRKNYDLENFQVLMWGGIFVPQVNVDFLAKIGKSLNKNQKLFVIGAGEKFEEFRNKIEDIENEKVVTTGWVEPEEIPKFYSAGDIGVFPFPDTLYHKCKCPIKLFEYMGTGLPVFTTPVGEPKYMVKKTGCGKICKTPKQFAKKAAQYEKKELQKIGKKGREYLKKNQNVKTQARNLKEIYEKALENKK